MDIKSRYIVILGLTFAAVSGPFYEASAAGLNLKNEPISPIPLKHNENPRIANLGRLLFNDTRLSANNTISCATCHDPKTGGVDGLPVSIGIYGSVGTINAPTVYNSSLNFVQFWDGRAANLEDQAGAPIQNPIEMNSNWDDVIGKLKADADYRVAFGELYPNGITREAISNAIATFERTLTTPNARFDQFLRGDKTAISTEELDGYLLFKSYGCSSCHQGAAVGGNMFEKMGALRDYFSDRGNITNADLGRFNVTGQQEHKFEFKVPSLRNIA
ncbi:MAG: cytochrome C biogenesis protein CcsA [Magnetovibrio sp.]|nr:cytochrome C biogenesis protein CcsA [Magnetovibrio sp.]